MTDGVIDRIWPDVGHLGLDDATENASFIIPRKCLDGSLLLVHGNMIVKLLLFDLPKEDARPASSQKSG